MCLAAGGCFSTGVKTPKNWVVEWRRATMPVGGEKQKYGTARLSSVVVRAPYDTTRLAVLRADGTVAFDPYNIFAASPAIVMRGAAEDVLRASGVFGRVVPAASQASADVVVEVVVTTLALDCREEGKREALVTLNATLLDGRKIISSVSCEGRAATTSGDFSAAFSLAFAQALTRAAGAFE